MAGRKQHPGRQDQAKTSLRSSLLPREHTRILKLFRRGENGGTSERHHLRESGMGGEVW